MHAYRFAYRRVSGLSRWLTIIITVLALGACSEIGTGLAQTSTATLPAATATPRSAPVATSTTATVTGTVAWKTYRNEQAGYTVDYPADWTIDERGESDGMNVTTFAPPGPNEGGTEITVIVQSGTATAGEIPDIPNTRCQPVTAGKLSGTRCFDTLAFSTTTTIVDQGKLYMLVGTGKRLDQNIYQHFLDSFALTA